MKNLTLGQYCPGSSLLHQLDPRGKITVLFLYYLFLFLIDDVLGYGVAIFMGVVILLFSGVSWLIYWRGSRFIILFLLLATALNLFLVSGTTLWQLGPLTITVQGLEAAAALGIRFILLVLTAYALTYTTTPMAITDALEKMGAPLTRLKVPVPEIAMMMSIALRFIPTLMDEAETIKKAQQSRGVDFRLRRPGVWTQNVIALAIPLFVSAFRRSEELALAMEARGYRGGSKRTMYRAMQLRSLDWLIILIFALLVVVAVIYRWLG